MILYQIMLFFILVTIFNLKIKYFYDLIIFKIKNVYRINIYILLLKQTEHIFALRNYFSVYSKIRLLLKILLFQTYF